MKFRFKLSLLLAVLAVGVLGVSAAAASAHQFLEFLCVQPGGKTWKFETETKCFNGLALSPADGEWERVDQLEAEVEAEGKEQGFEIAGATSVCMKGIFFTPGNIMSPTETILVHPEYKECEVALGGVHAATVSTTGCNFIFHAAAPNVANGTVDVECETGKEIVITVGGITGCTIKVPAQTGLGKIEYTNISNGEVEVKVKVTGIAWSAATACGLAKSSGTEGKYEEGSLTGGPKLTGKKATAIAKGFVGATQIGLMVE